MRLRKAEASFIGLAAALLIGVILSFANLATDTGLRLRGTIRSCLGGRSTPRQCLVVVNAHEPVVAMGSNGRAGDSLTVAEMRHALSGSSFFEILPSSAP
jgi:hypothetical protein